MQTSALNQEHRDSLLHLVAPAPDAQEAAYIYLPSCLSRLRQLRTGVPPPPCVLVPMWVWERAPQPLQSSLVKGVTLGAAPCHSCKTLATCPPPAWHNGERSETGQQEADKLSDLSRAFTQGAGSATETIAQRQPSPRTPAAAPCSAVPRSWAMSPWPVHR